MLFNSIAKLAAVVCVATVAFAAPAVDALSSSLSLEARQTDHTVLDLGAKLEEYANAAPKWDGTEAGIDTLDGKLYEAAVLAGKVRELFANSATATSEYGAQFNTVIHNDYEAASAAASDLTVRALPAQREKIRDYYHSLMFALSFILEDAFNRNQLQDVEQANNEFVPIFTKYWNEMNSIPQ